MQSRVPTALAERILENVGGIDILWEHGEKKELVQELVEAFHVFVQEKVGIKIDPRYRGVRGYQKSLLPFLFLFLGLYT